MKYDSYLYALYLSFYSRPFYQNVARGWKGLCFGYLLFILCLFWIPEMSRTQSEVSEFLSAEAPKYIRQVPVITISQGTVSLKEQVPYYINVPEKKTPFAIIDPSGQIASLDKTSASLLLTRTQLIVKNSPSGQRTFDLKGIADLTIDQKMLYDWLETFIAIFPIVLFPFVLFFSFLSHVLQALLSAWIGTLFAKKFHTDLDYKALIRLSAVSFTPAIILQSLHALFDISFPYRFTISFLVSLGYLYYAVGSNSEAASPKASEPS